MELTIRADVSAHMRELKQWLAQTRDEPAEDMNGFFAARVDTYEAHMSVWDKAYGRVAELTPGDCGPLLDLGCGTGLELDRIFARWPELAVTGVDLCAAMLEKLELYKKIHAALRPGGFFLEADYIACCEEEETLLRAESARRRARANIPADVFIHFDTPLTLEHELALLRAAGFSYCEAVDSIAGATFLRGRT